jgi:hypothetical protein
VGLGGWALGGHGRRARYAIQTMPERVERIRTLVHSLRSDETTLFQDEVDVHLNPKIGSCWMRRGQQAEVVTPGNNQKRHVAGSLHWRTRSLLVSEPSTRRNTEPGKKTWVA